MKTEQKFPFATALPWFLLIAAILLTTNLPAQTTPPRPNIIFIMADDVGWGDFQCYNPKGKVPSPNIDRLAKEGMRFTDAHTPAALCAPTRYAVATGNYTWRGRLPGGTWGWNQTPQFLKGQETVGHILSEAGYRTALFGKLHYGGVFETAADGSPDFTRPMKVGPREWGFDYSYVLLGGHQAPPYMFFENNRVDGDAKSVKQLEQGPLNGGVVPVNGPGLPEWDSRKVGQALLDKTIGFIDQCLAQAKSENKRQPFYIHLSTDGAHSPYTPPEEISGTPVKGASKMSAHTDMVHEVDVVVGKIVEALQKRNLLGETLIVVTSDNGGIPADRDQGHDAVGGLRGAKSTIWEGGHRVPFVVHWGDGTKAGSKVPPGTVRDQVIGTHDIVPTFAALAGAKPGPEQALDGVNLAPVFLGQRGDDQPVRETLLIQSSPGRDAFTERSPQPQAAAGKKKTAPGKKAAKQEQRKAAQAGSGTGSDGMAHALREGPWKLVIDIQDKPAALYNLKDDLGETKNLIQEVGQSERVQRMEKLYRQIRASKRSTPPLP